MPTVLAVDDDPLFRRGLCRALLDLGFDIVEASDGAEGIERLAARSFDLIVTDLTMPRADGFEVLAAARKLAPQTPVVMITATTSVDCVAALRAGAADYLSKPYHPGELEQVVRAAMTKPEEGRASRRPQAALLGESESLRAALAQIEAVARRDGPVLLDAEIGCGIEAFARLLHTLSKRVGGPFVTIAAALCDADALLSAARRAAGGTLFVDDLAALSRDAAEVLGKLHERHGVRILAGTTTPLPSLVESKHIDEALGAELRESLVAMPPLRERPEDVPLLVQHFVHEANRRHSLRVEVGAATLGSLQAYRFPGNIGELEEMVERLVLRARDKQTVDAGEEPTLVVDQVNAWLVLHDGESRRVSLTLSGGQTVEEALRGDSFLFVEDEGRTRHYARAQIAVVTVDDATGAADDVPRERANIHVRLSSGAVVEGELRWFPGATRRSVSAVLCDDAPVVVVHGDKITSFVAKSHIAWVEELPCNPS